MKEETQKRRMALQAAMYELELAKGVKQKSRLELKLSEADEATKRELAKKEYNCLSCRHMMPEGFLNFCPQIEEHVLYWRRGHKPRWKRAAKNCDLFDPFSEPVHV